MLDASVKKTCMRRTDYGGPHPHLLQVFTWRWLQVTCPDRWTSLTAWIEPPTSTWNRPNWLSLAPKHTGAEFDFRQGTSVIEHEKRWRKITLANWIKQKYSKLWLFISTTPELCYFWQLALAPLIKEPPKVHQVNPENNSLGKQRINRKKARGGWFH